MSIRLLMLPQLEAFVGEESGIKRVIEAYQRYLPKYGVVCVGKDDEYDLTAAHAGVHPGCDIAFCHGLYFTADYASSRWEYHANADVILSLRAARQITVPSSWVAETFQRDMRINPTVIGHGIEAHRWRHDYASEGYVLWNKNRTADVCNPYPVGVLARAFPGTTFVTTFSPDSNAPKASNIIVTGLVPHDQMMGHIQRAGVYLSTTKETFGIGVLEAMACFPAETRVQARDVVRSMERRYTGKLVTIKTKNATIRATAEHPFWTTEGWVHAIGLTKMHLLCYYGGYASKEKVHAGSIGNVHRALQNHDCKGNGNRAWVELQSGICRSMGYGGAQDIRTVHQAASDQSDERAACLYCRNNRRRRHDYDQAPLEEDKTACSNIEHVLSADGLASKSIANARSGCCENNESEIWSRRMLHVSRGRVNSFAIPEGHISVSCYKETPHGTPDRVDGASASAIQIRPIDSETPRDYGTDQVPEYQTIEEISIDDVVDLPVYNFTTLSGTYLAEGYLVHNCGVPILGFAHGGNLDLIQHGINGYLAEPGNFDDLKRGLDYCLRYQRQLGQNGLKLVQDWTWDKAVEKVAAVIRKATEPEDRPMRIDSGLYAR